jgi:hypothetical protein
MDKDLFLLITTILGVLSGIALILMGLLIPCPTEVILYSLVSTGTLIIATMFGVSAVDSRLKNGKINGTRK